MGGDQEEKDKYSIGRVIGKHISAQELNVDWFDDWEKNEDYQAYFKFNKKPKKLYFCKNEACEKNEYCEEMTEIDVPLFDSQKEIVADGKKCCLSDECKFKGRRIGVLNECSVNGCNGKLELVVENGSKKVKCNSITCGKYLVKRPKYYQCTNCTEKRIYH